uniref:AlNc14C95G5838 protein n=1 Tax=Albugo laibachii Nc14 TaxID=890382 RepID=F0WGW2_9STRA|nr:AlNc14C95G5838 [Albugo laibachii Nc14]|eukprot:CCA20477.1 AlNc14C95G5838 [Albugo laibachii Nc14]
MPAKRSFLSMFVWWIMFWAVLIIPVTGRSATNHGRLTRKLQYLAPRDHSAPPRMERRIPGNNDWTPYNQMEAERVMARRETAPEFAPETDRMEADTATTATKANTSVPNKPTSTNSTSPNSNQNQTDSSATTMLVPDSSTSQSSSGSNGSDSSHDKASDESTGSNESKEPVSSGIALLPGLYVLLLLPSMLSML